MVDILLPHVYKCDKRVLTLIQVCTCEQGVYTFLSNGFINGWDKKKLTMMNSLAYHKQSITTSLMFPWWWKIAEAVRCFPWQHTLRTNIHLMNSCIFLMQLWADKRTRFLQSRTDHLEPSVNPCWAGRSEGRLSSLLFLYFFKNNISLTRSTYINR